MEDLSVMKQSIKITIPSYVSGFRCIGPECEDSCCIGWDIDIDKITYRKYFRTKDMLMKKEFIKHVYRNEESHSDDVDYGRVRIDESKNCPFLDKDKLCRIYRNLGEDSLSNVCYSYPRVYNILNGVYELSLFLSCPEAVRRLFASTDPITFIDQEIILDKHIINSCINTGESRWNGTDVRRLKELRQKSIGIIQDRTFSMTDRLIRLGYELKQNKSTNSRQGYGNQKWNAPFLFQLDFFTGLLKSLHVSNEIDSRNFVVLTDKIKKGLSLQNHIPHAMKAELYEQGMKIADSFLSQKGYFMEHYLVNFMFQGNFPFTENRNTFDGYLMLVVRYSFIRFYLAGLASHNGQLREEDVVLMIQVFTKTIEHHKTFLADVLENIKADKFDNMDFATAVLSLA